MEHSGWLWAREPARNDNGSTFVEFALVFPLLIILTLALIDFSRCITLRSILDSAANRAVSVASVIQDLDTDCRYVTPGEQSLCAGKRQDSIRRILDEARQLPRGIRLAPKKGSAPQYFHEGDDVMPAIELVLERGNLRAYYKQGDNTAPVLSFDPRLPAGPSLQEVLQRQPIEVTVRGGVRPYLWLLGDLSIVGRAVGYRERRNVPAYPARLDCQSTEIPAGGTAANVCPCASDPLEPTKISVNSGPCGCRPGLIYVEEQGGSFKCVCPQGSFYQTDTKGSCTKCPYGDGKAAGCALTQFFEPSKCRCAPCPNSTQQSSTGNSCVCPADFATNNPCAASNQFADLGKCACGTCPGYTQKAPNGTSCQCPIDFATNNPCTGKGQYADLAKCACGTCPGQATPNAGRTGCVCSLECNAALGETLDPVNCLCKGCPPQKIWDGVKCVCPKSCGEGTVQRPDCTCVSCEPPLSVVNNVCVCSKRQSDCPKNSILNSATCKCVPCEPPYKVSGNSCVCGVSASECAKDGLAFNSATCSCYACQPGQVVSGGSCSCPTIPCYGGVINTTNCSCTCPPERPVLVGGTHCGPTVCATEVCITGDGGAFRPE